MKTSELKKIVEDNGYSLIETDNDFYLYLNNEKVGYVNKKYSRYYLTDSRVIDIKVAQAILDYAYTPLEEREEEERYLLRLPKEFVFSEMNAYLNVNTLNLKCILGSRENCSIVKTQFTQKEIDAMPFDTNFFIKENVK